MSDHTSVDIYEQYCEDVEDPLSKEDWQNLCIDFNTKVMEQIIYKGRVFNMGERLSTIEIVRVARNFDNPTIDWNASNQLKQEIIDEGGTPYSKDNPDGEKWFVYYTDNYYYRFNWAKSGCVVQNKSAYRFDATRGRIGNKTKLKEHINSNNLVHYKYRTIE